MPYLSSLLRQSNARIGAVVRFQRPQRPAGLEVDHIHVVPPTPSGQEASPTAAPEAPGPKPTSPEPENSAASPPPASAAAVTRTSEPAEPAHPQPPLRAVPVPVVAATESVEPRERARARAREASSRPAEAPPVSLPPPTPTPTAPATSDPPRAFTRTADPEVPLEQRVLRQVAEVVAWVAAGAEDREPERVETTIIQPARTHVPSAPATAPTRPHADRPDQAVSNPEAGDVRVSVGRIELTVEAPDAPAPALPPAPPPPPRAAEPVPAPSGVGLTRHYLRF